MMRLVASLIFTLAFVCRAESVVVDGRVVDGSGRPIARATVAPYWSANGTGLRADGTSIDFDNIAEVRRYWWGNAGEMVARDAKSRATTDAEGRFTIDVHRAFHSLFAIGPEHQFGGIASIPIETANPIAIELKRLVRVSGQFSGDFSGKTPEWSHVYVKVPTEPNWSLSSCRIAACGSYECKFEVLLPPGEYLLDAYGVSSAIDDDIDLVLKEPRRIMIKPGRDTFDVGVVPFVTAAESPIDSSKKAGRWNEIDQSYGKQAPEWHISDARGIEQSTRLADLRGKWVLLYFWHLSCRPCVADSIPELMKLCGQHASKRKRFEVMAFYMDWNSETASISDLEKQMQPYQQRVWGRQIPFPILLDDSRATFERYGVSAAGISVLVDPNGNLVRGGVDELKKVLALEEALNSPGQRP